MGIIADVFKVLLKDKATGKIFATTTLTDAGLAVTVGENEVRGGQGDPLRGIIHSNRDIELNLTDTEFHYDWVAMKAGKDIVTGAGVAYAFPEWYEVGSSSDINLKNTPLSDSDLVIFDSDGKEIDTGTLSGETVTFASGVSEGDKVEVRTYKYQTDANTETIEFDTNTFTKGVEAILETLEIDERTEAPLNLIQFQFENALPDGSFSISTQSERQATSMETKLRVVKPKTSNVLGKSLRIPIAA
ncbi:hypothetical protein [Chengkuizengella marina]|uniref:Uncharacterized protein n=1 Tax=Chengkuizengella marina TaxID=2507566 RepID=A0A6N9Q2L0_9BACL|nr:hypothetical protein [Chengkuizengella marina]NBI28598.1 hypothetical protein [Chengkuizengella marina]